MGLEFVLGVDVKELLECKTPVRKPERFLCFLVLNVYHTNERHICIVCIILSSKLLALRGGVESLPLVSGRVMVWDLKRLSTARTSLHGLILVLPLFMVNLFDDLVDFFVVHVIELFEILVVVHEYIRQRLLLT